MTILQFFLMIIDVEDEFLYGFGKMVFELLELINKMQVTAG